jgi:O-antigen/teichoic acid export membrane protein
MLLASIGVARMLGTQEFGEFGVIQSTVGLFGVFAGFGLGVTTTKFVAEYRSINPQKTGRIIALSNIIALTTGSVMAIALFIGAPYLAEKIFGAPHLSLLLQIGAGLLFFSALNGLQTGTLAGFEAFRVIAKVNMISGIFSFPLILGGTYFFRLDGAVWGLMISMATNCMLNNIALRKITGSADVPVVYTGCFAESPIIWRFCIPAVISGMVAAPITWACTAVLVNQPNGYIEIGIYSAVTKFQMLVTYTGSMLGSALLPILASREAASNETFNRSNVVLSWALGFSAAIPLICFPEIVEFIFGNQFEGLQTRKTVVLVMCFTCITLYRQGLTRTIIANEMMWWGLLDNLLWAAILSVSFFFLRHLGAVGMAGSFLIAYALNTIIFVPFYTRKALVPFGIMISKEAYLIWGILTAMALFSYMGSSLIFRSVLFLFGVFFLFFAFKRLVKINNS